MSEVQKQKLDQLLEKYTEKNGLHKDDYLYQSLFVEEITDNLLSEIRTAVERERERIKTAFLKHFSEIDWEYIKDSLK